MRIPRYYEKIKSPPAKSPVWLTENYSTGIRARFTMLCMSNVRVSCTMRDFQLIFAISLYFGSMCASLIAVLLVFLKQQSRSVTCAVDEEFQFEFPEIFRDELM